MQKGASPHNTALKQDLGHSVISKRDDGIIVIEALEDHTYTVADIKENHLIIQKMSGGKKAYILNIAGNYTNIESEARLYVSQGPHKDFIAAECFVIHSLAQRILANFYLKINKPVVASAFFNDEQKAEKWLKDLVQKDAN